MANFGMKLLSFMQDKGPILGELKLLELFVCFSSVDATNEASSDADTSSHVQPFWHTLLPPVHGLTTPFCSKFLLATIFITW
jgi:hypothetical protein